MKNLITQLDVLELKVSIAKAQRIINFVRHAVVTDDHAAKVKASAMSQSLSELRERIEVELEGRIIYYVPSRNASFIRSAETAFGPDVSDKFPGTVADIAEASACLGMSRNTAVVFHLMRAMEHAVAQLGDRLDVTIIDKHNNDLEWGKIIANIKATTEALPKGKERDDWSEAVSLLYHVKQAWRNSTMHPKQSYTDDEALGAFNAVRSFMANLSLLI